MECTKGSAKCVAARLSNFAKHEKMVFNSCIVGIVA